MGVKTTSATISRKPFLALAFLSMIWGYNWVVMKEGLRFCDPFVFAAIRVSLAAVFLFAILLWSKQSVRPRQVKLTILLGLLSTTFGLGLPMWALASGGAAPRRNRGARPNAGAAPSALPGVRRRPRSLDERPGRDGRPPPLGCERPRAGGRLGRGRRDAAVQAASVTFW